MKKIRKIKQKVSCGIKPDGRGICRVFRRLTVCFMMDRPFVIFGIICCCVSMLSIACHTETESRRAYFKVDPADRKIMIPVGLNDSLSVDLTSGGHMISRRVHYIGIRWNWPFAATA